MVQGGGARWRWPAIVVSKPRWKAGGFFVGSAKERREERRARERYIYICWNELMREKMNGEGFKRYPLQGNI